jgi:AcrR family transcriptional regulator
MPKDKTRPEGITTRDHIIAVARQLFATYGYLATSTEKVLARTGISRGALYHHFENKEALFAAVLEAVERDLAAGAAQNLGASPDPVEALRTALGSFLRRARDQEIRSIVLTDAHSVVGWQKWREIEERYGLGLLKTALARISESGRIAPAMVDVYAHIILASMIEIAFMISRSEDSAAEIERGTLAMNQLLERLLQPS